MPFDTLWNTAIGNIITVFAGSLPGVALGIWLPDLIGRRTQQFWWSLGTALMYAVWAGVTNIASTGALVALFTLSQLVIASGPNITTFLIPVEVFPTRVRGSAHGLSAAAGKAGALITSFAFGSAVDNIGMNGVLGLFTGIMVLTAIFTLWIPEAKGYSLEDIENDVMYGKRPYDVEETESSDICKTDTLVAGNALAKDVKESNTVTEVGKAA
jgi:PHS family inorganic phosphate transporter-like MFS transporter